MSSLTVAAIALDGLDGYLARSRGLATALGAQIDILGDRIVENLFFTFFAVSGLISALDSGALFRPRNDDGFPARPSCARRPHRLWLEFDAGDVVGAKRVASRGSRAAYATLKCLCFCYLGLLLPLRNFSGTWLAASAFHSLTLAGEGLVAATAAFCVVRAVPGDLGGAPVSRRRGEVPPVAVPVRITR